jgi:hypothetical protein
LKTCASCGESCIAEIDLTAAQREHERREPVKKVTLSPSSAGRTRPVRVVPDELARPCFGV